MASVHFSIGKGAAELLVNIAREHIQYDLNPEKGLDAHPYHPANDAELPRITPQQKKAIYEYGQLCCGGILKFGIKYQAISAAHWNITDDLMLHKLFEF